MACIGWWQVDGQEVVGRVGVARGFGVFGKVLLKSFLSG
jgi:hypothetical protein